AEWINVSVDDLRELNPELRRTTTPKVAHDLKVPVGTAATIQTQLLTADSLYAKFGNTFHTVKRGETIATIARSYKVSQSELRQANELTVKSTLRANQELMIPQRTTNSLPSASAVRTARAAATARPVAALTYRVQRGDTLFSIARQFDTTVDSIKRLNQLNTDRISVGARLTVRR
ncbi:MAG: LysM peptidoglycan-binding domain-containing protein, partial [Acidobacteriota bacterium]